MPLILAGTIGSHAIAACLLMPDGLSCTYGLNSPFVKDMLKFTTFLNLVNMFKHEFAFGERGLNNYLSTRIRHGVLPTALRRPAIDESLYVPDKEKLENFKSHSKWFGGEMSFSGADAEKIFKFLKKYTRDFEGLIEEINNEWLQINYLDINSSELVCDGGSVGLFDFTTSISDIRALQEKLPLSPTYNDFVSVVTQWLWDRTDSLAENVRNRIQAEAFGRGVKLLDELKAESARVIVSGPEMSEFFNAIDRAKSSLQSQCELVGTWFTRPDSNEKEVFDFNHSIDISSKSLNLDVKLNNRVRFQLTEESLNNFVDIFSILLENCVSKSGLPKEDLCVLVDAGPIGNDKVYIQVSNKCDLSESRDEREDSLKFYRNAYGDENLIKNVINKEGGTGLFRIWKILDRDMSIQHKTNFYFTQDGRFVIRVEMEIEGTLRII